MLKIILKKNEEVEKLNGYPWIFSNEIDRFEGDFESGKVCIVYKSKPLVSFEIAYNCFFIFFELIILFIIKVPL